METDATSYVLTRAPKVVRVAAINVLPNLTDKLDRILLLEQESETEALASIKKTVSGLRLRVGPDSPV